MQRFCVTRSSSFGKKRNDPAGSPAYKRFAEAKPCMRRNSFSPHRVKCGVPAGPALWGAMQAASKMLEFEYAAILRDQIIELRKEQK